MTATDELRRLLDGRGVEWRGGLPTETMVDEPIDLLYVERPDGTLHVFVRSYLTPAQAVEATLGRGTCHDTQEDEERFCCSECGKKSYIVTQYREFDEYGTKTAGWIEVCTPRFCPNCGAKVVGA